MAAYKDLEQQYGQAMEEHGFIPDPENRRYGSMGLCWRHSSRQGGGFFWTYGQQDLYTIKIHDFFFHEDQLLEFHWPESLSVTWYESISGEEFSPAAVLFQAVSKVLSAVGNHTGRSSTGRSPSFPLAWRSPRLTTGIICAASFPRSIKAYWSPFKRWIRQSTSRKWCSS